MKRDEILTQYSHLGRIYALKTLSHSYAKGRSCGSQRDHHHFLLSFAVDRDSRPIRTLSIYSYLQSKLEVSSPMVQVRQVVSDWRAPSGVGLTSRLYGAERINRLHIARPCVVGLKPDQICLPSLKVAWDSITYPT